MLSTKAGRLLLPGLPTDASAEEWPGSFPFHQVYDYSYADAMNGGYRALDELRRAGDIKAIGLGVKEAQVCEQAMNHGQWDAFLLEGRYTLLEQSPLDGLFPSCKKAGTSIILGGPFNSGILVGGDTWNYAKAPSHIVDKVKAIASVCAAHSIDLPAALQFPLGSP